jgi:hypothetical protein
MLHFRIDRVFSAMQHGTHRSRQALEKTTGNLEIDNSDRTLTTFVSAILANLTFHGVGGMGMMVRRTRHGARCFLQQAFPLKAR